MIQATKMVKNVKQSGEINEFIDKLHNQKNQFGSGVKAINQTS